MAVIVGDLPYADGWTSLWDSFGRMLEPFGSRYPLLTTGGNHEIGSSEAWQSYRIRYPTPASNSDSTNFCYWGIEVGVVNMIALCSYTGFTNGTLQFQWLQNYLATKINRVKTPWIVVVSPFTLSHHPYNEFLFYFESLQMMHVPWYNSNDGHW